MTTLAGPSPAVLAVLTVLGGLQIAAAGLTTTLGASRAAWSGMLSPCSLVVGCRVALQARYRRVAVW